MNVENITDDRTRIDWGMVRELIKQKIPTVEKKVLILAYSTLIKSKKTREQKLPIFVDLQTAKERLDREAESIRSLNLDYEGLVSLAAKNAELSKFYRQQNEENLWQLAEAALAIAIFSLQENEAQDDEIIDLIKNLSCINSPFIQDITRGLEIQKSRQARQAVSHRGDQKLKRLWEEHCKNAVKSGVKISQLNDLFQIDGCSTEFKKHVDVRTLKRWAKDSAGIKLKPGRPKK